MGMQTRYLGALTITPPLCQEEVIWLRAHQLTDFSLHPDDPYPAAMNPTGEKREADEAGASRSVRGGGFHRPPWIDWAPTPHGTHLRWQEADKSNDPIPQIRYFIEHFLKPGAHASEAGREEFAAFSFDHVVNGFVAAERSDGRLYLVEARDNEVREVLLASGAMDRGEW